VTVLGLLLIGSAAASALLLAAAARFSSLVSFLLVAYLAFVANLGIVTLALSPFREVTRTGLVAAEAVAVAGAFGAWWVRGRPGLPLTAARVAVRAVVGDPVTALFLVVVLFLLAYELVLAGAPPNNMDALTYHLARAAAWAQHGGIYWVQNVPEIEVNQYQQLAEQQNMFLLVATGGGTLYALPQYLAELAILVAIYGASRRLGFGTRPAASSAFLFATFPLVALEAVTAQNDLFAASLVAVAATLLLGEGILEPALAGAAAGLGLGTKLTTAVVLPILFWLALSRGRRTLKAALAGGLVGFLTLGIWSYLLNLIHTGQLLGSGTAALQYRSSPSYPGSVANAFYLMYGMMDLSVLSNHLIYTLAVAGLVGATSAGAWAYRRASFRRALGDAAKVATPFLAPLLVLGGAGVLAFIARRWGFPIRGPNGILGPLENNLNEVYTRFANEDYSAFGPIGIIALLAATTLTIRGNSKRLRDSRQLALACALPGFLIFLSLELWWAPFLIRYFLVPAVLTAPLLARLFRGQATTAAYLTAATITIGLTITHNQAKPLTSPYGYGHPWNLTQQTALDENAASGTAASLASYDTVVPAHACVGAVLSPNDPFYLLFGPRLEHRLVFLPVSNAVDPALEHGLSYVVFTTGPDSWDAVMFRAVGWNIRTLAGNWRLATRPHPTGIGTCGR
jgi:hypothetical protein